MQSACVITEEEIEVWFFFFLLFFSVANDQPTGITRPNASLYGFFDSISFPTSGPGSCAYMTVDILHLCYAMLCHASSKVPH
jgi:hypothetical protein